MSVFVLHLALSLLMFHPSLLFLYIHFDITFTSTRSCRTFPSKKRRTRATPHLHREANTGAWHTGPSGKMVLAIIFESFLVMTTLAGRRGTTDLVPVRTAVCGMRYDGFLNGSIDFPRRFRLLSIVQRRLFIQSSLGGVGVDASSRSTPSIRSVAILAQAISCPNVGGVFPVHELFWFCLVQVSTTQFCSFSPVLMASVEDG